MASKAMLYFAILRTFWTSVVFWNCRPINNIFEKSFRARDISCLLVYRRFLLTSIKDENIIEHEGKKIVRKNVFSDLDMEFLLVELPILRQICIGENITSKCCEGADAFAYKPSHISISWTFIFYGKTLKNMAKVNDEISQMCNLKCS